VDFTQPSLPFRAALLENLAGTRSMGFAGITVSNSSTLDDITGPAIKKLENKDKANRDNFILRP